MSGLSLFVESPTGAFVRDAECDLCGANEVELLATQDRRGKPLRTVVCTRCGLISHESIPTDDELSEYYARDYRHDYHGESQPSAKPCALWLEAAGVRDILTKSLGSSSVLNVAHATLMGLQKLRKVEAEASMRGKPVEDLKFWERKRHA